MADEFEWVEKGSAEEKKQESNTLPVAVRAKKKPSYSKKIWFVVWKIFVILGTLILALFAKLLLLLARIKIPAVHIPEPVKKTGVDLYGRAASTYRQAASFLASVEFHRPSWLKVPDFVSDISVPSHFWFAVLSGFCFVLILGGTGALFAVVLHEGSIANYVLILLGIAAAAWLFWTRSAATVVATWLLRYLRNRNSSR